MEKAEKDPVSAKSRSGYLITYANCPLHWVFKLQTEVALSTTEAEYIALSLAMREVLPLLRLLREMKGKDLPIPSELSSIKCTVFEDNEGTMELARTTKLRPRTKHINVKFHHFRASVEEGETTLVKVDTSEQQADILTKALSVDQLKRLRQDIMGW